MVAAIYQGFIKDEAGNIIEGASVEVRDQDTNALVTIWSNRATTSTKTNPTTTDSEGYFFFYRTAGRYKITVTKDSFTAIFNNVNIGTSQEYDTGTDAGQIPLNSDLSTVAASGDYDDLTNKPTLGTVAALDTGTASGEIRTNTQNDARFFQIGNNLSEGTASAMRANLELGSGDDVTFNTVTVATIDTGQGANELYAMDQAVRTTDAVTFAQINGDNIRIDGNTISSTDTNGNITLDPNGTGTVELVAVTNVAGAISATVSSGTSITAKNSTSTSTASIRVNTDANTGVSLVAYGSTYAGGSIMGVGANGTAFNADGDVGINAGSAKTVRLGSGNSESMRILSNGNVHIGGTSDPGVKLGVTGAITSTTDSTFNGVRVGKGAGDVATNTAAGYQVLNANTTGTNNTGAGYRALYVTTTGVANTAIGSLALDANTTGNNNTAVGSTSLSSTITGTNNTAIGVSSLFSLSSGSNNAAVGLFSGRYLADGVTALTTVNNSTYIGTSSRASAESVTNETVIGYLAIGNGTNTVTIGNSSVTANYFSGAISATGTITTTGAANIHRASGDLDTTGIAYTSFQDNSTGSYVERGWMGFGVGDGDIDINNVAGDVHLRVSNVRILTGTSTTISTPGYLLFSTGAGVGLSTERWIGGDNGNSTYYNVPTTKKHLFGVANTNVLEVTGSGVDVTGATTTTTFAKVGSYTVSGAATLGASSAGAGAIIFVTDETGGAVLAFSDGTDWRRVTDRAVIS